MTKLAFGSRNRFWTLANLQPMNIIENAAPPGLGDKADILADARLARRLHKRNKKGETPIHLATIRDNAKQVSQLVRLGADVNCADFAGWSPLHEACNRGWLQVAQLLIKAGANVDARGPDDVTPLHDAAVNGHHKVVELLLQSKAIRDPITADGQTPLALGQSHPQVVDLLQPEVAQLTESENVTTATEPTVAAGSSHGDQGGADKQLTLKLKSQSDTKSERCPKNMRKSSPQHQTPKGPDKPSSPRLTLRFQPIKNRDDHHGGGGQSSKTNNEVHTAEPRYQSYCVTMETGDDAVAGHGKLKRSGSVGCVDNQPGAPQPSTTASDHCYDQQQQTAVTSGGNGGRLTTSGHTSDGAETGNRADAVDIPVAPVANSHSERHNRPVTTELRGSGDGHHAEVTDRNSDVAVASHALPVESKSVDDDDRDDGLRKRRKELDRDAAGGEHGAKLTTSDANNGGSNASLRNYVGKAPGVGGGGDERRSPHKAAPGNRSGSDTESTPSDAELEVEGDCEVTAAAETAVSSGLPKVPPLKIVIPPSAASEQDRDCNRTVNRQALPYIVSVSGDSVSDGSSGGGMTHGGPSADKEGVVREDVKSRDGMGVGITDEQRSQRVTRSRAAHGGPTSTSTHASHVTTVAVLNSSSGEMSFVPQAESAGSGEVAMLTADDDAEVMPSMVTSPPAKSRYGETGECLAEDLCGPEVPPRKRKMRTRDGVEGTWVGSSASSSSSSTHGEEQSILNCYEMFLNIRKQIDRRRKRMYVVQPKPPQGFKDYLMNRCSYVLAGNSASRLSVPMISPPQSLTGAMKELFESQEKERYNLRLQHLIEKEKLVLMVEQEILRVHSRAARATANQTVPFSVCSILRDEEVYNQIEPEQEEKERNARTRFTGRHLLSWLQDVDDKWEKVKEAMLLRHHNEAESLHAAQKLEWEWKMKELSMCDTKSTPVIDVIHVPMVHVSDEFDLLTVTPC